MLTVLLAMVATAWSHEPPRPDGVPAGSCYDAGEWTPSGEHKLDRHGCNPRLCEDGAWGLQTLVDCSIRIGDRLYFEVGAVDIPAEQAPLIPELAKLMAMYPAVRVVIEGHTTASEQRADPGLGDRRAGVVFSALVGAGVPAAHLLVVDRGASLPLVASPEAEHNRRVSFTVFSQ